MATKFTKITRAAVRKLVVGERLAEHGIEVERLRTGDTRYSVNIMVNGARIHRVVGRESEGVTREQAEKAIETFRTRAREERLALPKGRKLQRSFAEAARDYLRRMEETGGKDLGNKRRHLRDHLIPAIGKERLDKITAFRLRQYRTARRSKGAKEATINRELWTLSHLMRRASKEWGWIGSHAVPIIPMEKETRKKIRILTSEQADELLQAAIEDHDPRAWLFVMFGLHTAMRHSEIVARRFDEVDFSHNRIWINRAKAGEREQPITPSLAFALLKARDQAADMDGWIFPASRKDTKSPYRPDMRDAFARSVTRAGLNPKLCTPHVLRHTAITRLVKAGADLMTVKRISGHKTTAMVEHYTHIHGNHIDAAMKALDCASGAITHELHADVRDDQQAIAA